MFRSVLVSLATLATLHAQSSGITTQCRWDSGRGTSFDLSSMQIAPGGYYKVLDMRNPSTSYYFNVCGKLICGSEVMISPFFARIFYNFI